MSKSIYERVLSLRNRISLDGDDTIYEEDYLLLDEVLDYIEDSEQRVQEETYNDTIDIYKELEIGATIKKQEKLLSLYKELLKRNEPMKVISFDSSSYFGMLGYSKCHKCGEILTKGYYNYCPYCGQKLDWSDEQ